MFVYLVTAEKLSLEESKGEVLVFRRGHKSLPKAQAREDEECPEVAGRRHHSASGEATRPESTARIQQHTSIFHWQDVCYEVAIKGKRRLILDHVDGWVKPGTLTALMVISPISINLPLDLSDGRALLELARRHY